MVNFYTGYAYVDSWTVPTTCTICYWIVIRGYNGSGTNRFFGTADNFEIKFLTGTEKFQADVYANTGEAPSSTATVNTRYHVAVAGQRTVSVKTYINAVLAATDSDVDDTPSSPASLGVGGRYGNSSAANGDLEDVRVYNRVLSAAEIQNICFCNGTDCIFDGLVYRWPLLTKGDGTDISTDILYDTMGKKNVAKSSNNAYYRGGFLQYRRRV